MSLTLNPHEQDLVQEIRGRWTPSYEGVHKDFRDRGTRLYRLYRNYQEFQTNWRQADGRDRDAVIWEERDNWGASLAIPIAFSVIETIAPRAVAHRPRMLYLPRREIDEPNVENVRMLHDAQQDQIDYEQTLQNVLKSGLIYNIGWQKTFWREEWASRRRVVEAPPGKAGYEEGERERVCTFNDPDAECCDGFDVVWDPFAHSIRSCRWIIHRTWRDLRYCMDRIKYGQWKTDAAKALTEEDLRAMSAISGYTEIWAERRQAAGVGNYADVLAGEQMHEVWEFHDGERVITILDGQVPVQEAENPSLGHLPFQAYRPTLVPREMVGIGEIEMLEHLIYEFNTARRQRRDAATLRLRMPFLFDEGMIDSDDLVFEPNTGIPVRGKPQDAFFPLRIDDVPGSSYQETAEILRDIWRGSGISDETAGGEGDPGGAQDTATGAQLRYASINKRIENKARLLEIDVIRPAAKVFLALNQRKILEKREVRQELPPDPAASPNVRRFEWFKIGPAELEGEFEIVPEGGSTQPENTPQLRDDAMRLHNMYGGDPDIDQAQLKKKELTLMGVKHPETWLAIAPGVPPAVLELLKRGGVPESMIETAVRMAQAQQPAAGQQQVQSPGPEA